MPSGLGRLGRRQLRLFSANLDFSGDAALKGLAQQLAWRQHRRPRRRRSLDHQGPGRTLGHHRGRREDRPRRRDDPAPGKHLLADRHRGEGFPDRRPGAQRRSRRHGPCSPRSSSRHRRADRRGHQQDRPAEPPAADRQREAAGDLLKGVDIILSAGSNTRLGDADDVAADFPGHGADFDGTYPLVTKGPTARRRSSSTPTANTPISAASWSTSTPTATSSSTTSTTTSRSTAPMPRPENVRSGLARTSTSPLPRAPRATRSRT